LSATYALANTILFFAALELAKMEIGGVVEAVVAKVSDLHEGEWVFPFVLS